METANWGYERTLVVPFSIFNSLSERWACSLSLVKRTLSDASDGGSNPSLSIRAEKHVKKPETAEKPNTNPNMVGDDLKAQKGTEYGKD